MKEQVENSKSASKFKGLSIDLSLIQETKFLGYDRLESKGKVLGIWLDENETEQASNEHEYLIALDQTPFYAESGGQVGDNGTFSFAGGDGLVLDCNKQGKIFLHSIQIKDGLIKKMMN